jgi:uncharacterized protein (TIGR02996 family)
MAVSIPTEQAALLAAIVAQPDDDTLRLVYADWLQEHGDEEQAACIRDAVRVGMMPKCTEKAEATRQLDERIEMRAGGWLQDIGVLRLEGLYCGSGMWPPQQVTYLSMETFLEDAPALFTGCPIRSLNLDCQRNNTVDTEQLEAVAALSGLSNLQKLTLAHFEMCGLGWRYLICSPHLGNLRTLGVQGCGLTDEHAHALADCPNLADLTTLDLSENEMGFAGMLAIVRSPYLGKVERLSLMNDRTIDELDQPEYEELSEALRVRFGSDQSLWTPISS